MAPLLLLSTLVFEPNRALAQEAKARDAADPQLEYRRAHEAMSQNKWKEAREVLLGLWKRAETYDVAASLGEVEFELGHYDTAARYVTFALAHIPPKEKRETAERYRAALQSIKNQVGTVRISSNLSMVEVRVDGATVGVTPLTDDLYLSPGSHKVSGQTEGSALEKTLAVEAGKTYQVALTLSPPHPASPPADAPSHPARQASSQTMDERSGLEAKTLVLIGGSTITAVLVGFGVTGALRAQSAQDNADRLRDQAVAELGHNCAPDAAQGTCANLASELDRRNSANRLERYSFAGAGLVAVATAAFYLLLPDRESSQPKHESSQPKRESSVALSIQPQATSIELRGSF